MPKSSSEVAQQLAKTVRFEEQIADEYGELFDWQRQWKLENREKLARLESHGKLIRSWYADLDAASFFHLEGDKYKLTIGPREWKRTVDVAKAVRLWKMKIVRALLSITITALEAAVGKEEAARAITAQRTGSREITAVRK